LISAVARSISACRAPCAHTVPVERQTPQVIAATRSSIARIADTAGEGARAFIHVDAEAAIEAAEAMDRLREVKAAPSPFAGIPVSIKDLFDIKGQVTRAGSRALDDSAPAEADAPAVARLRRPASS
jgi:Asp-tRNA(Asn)/Glu-tRNA(Gln) amidotransferase A subunit family amidase